MHAAHLAPKIICRIPAGGGDMLVEMTPSDLDLLQQFTRDHAQDAFTELVRRHVNLVYSAALRQVRSPQLAEEVAQSVFADLAREAGKLKPDTILTAWLHAVTRRTAIDVIRKESRRQLREQIAYEMKANDELSYFAKYENQPVWSEIEPLLDEAVAALDDTDRAAVLLRFFENKSLLEVGHALGVSDDTAQKRVSRAVEKLREFFAKRGVSVGASGLVVVISANAVQAAPVGLAATISAAAVLTGTTLATTTTATITKAIAMTTLQKTIVTATIAILAGTGIYEARQASQLREQAQTLQQERTPLTEQLMQLKSENERLSNQVARSKDSQALSKEQLSELLKLRGKVGVAQADARELAKLKSTLVKQSEKSPSSSNIIAGGMAAAEMFQAMGSSEQRAQLGLMKKVLNLTEDQAQAISELMQKQKRREMDMAMKSVAGKMTPEQRQAMVAERSNPEDEIKSLLTPEQSAAYPEYQQAEKIGAANRLANAEASLIANEFDLSKEQQDQIRAPLSQIHLNEPASGPNTKAISAATASGNLADAASMSIELSKSQLEAKLKILGGVLKPKQIDAYREQQLRQLNLMATMMKTILPEKTAENAN